MYVFRGIQAGMEVVIRYTVGPVYVSYYIWPLRDYLTIEGISIYSSVIFLKIRVEESFVLIKFDSRVYKVKTVKL